MQREGARQSLIETTRNPDDRPAIEWLVSLLIVASWGAVVAVQYFVH
jgi:hypothetical protein